MTWSPNPTLTIGGVDYTGRALETVRITRGRSEIYEEPRAGYLICELIDLEGTGIPVRSFDTVEFTIDDSAGIPRKIFVGEVSDRTTNLLDAGFEADRTTAITTIIAVGPLAKVATRRVATTGLPAEQDGERILNLLFQALAGTWEETGGTWAQQLGTWDGFDPGFDASTIDQPGTFDIAALPPLLGGYSAQAEGFITSLSALGILWDNREGRISYADANRRITTDQTDDYLDLPAAVIGTQGLGVLSQAGDITTDVVVTHPNGTERVIDASAILEFGRVTRSFSVNLADQANAQLWGERYLVGHSGPVLKLNQLPVRVDLIADDTLRDALITLDVNDGIRLIGLPAAVGLTFRRTFLEGLTWSVDRDRINVALNLSDAVLSINFQRWSSVVATIRWQDVDATLTWQDATIVST